MVNCLPPIDYTFAYPDQRLQQQIHEYLINFMEMRAA